MVRLVGRWGVRCGVVVLVLVLRMIIGGSMCFVVVCCKVVR